MLKAQRWLSSGLGLLAVIAAMVVGGEDDPESRGRLSISVADTGLGIARDKQRLLFQEFVRLGPTAEPGVGIGLAMSARIAEVLGGTITVRDFPNYRAGSAGPAAADELLARAGRRWHSPEQLGRQA